MAVENTSPSSISALDRYVSAGLFGGFFVLYVLTAATSVLGGDNGEFSSLHAVTGVAHPPGYPLYTLYLRFLRAVLPSCEPAHGAAMCTAVLGAATVGVLYLACRQWTASRLGSSIAACAFGSSDLAWNLATHAEVFSLNGLLAVLIIWASSPVPVVRPRCRCLLLGLLAGLALANHHSAVLIFPVGLFGFASCIFRASKRWMAIGLGIGGLVLGLSAYLYLPWAYAHGDRLLIWGKLDTTEGILAHVLRRDYGTFSLSVSKFEKSPLSQIIFLARTLWGSGLGLLALGGVLGCMVIAVRTSRRVWTGWQISGWTCLLLSFLASGPLFLAQFNLEPAGVHAPVVRRFHLLPLLVCVPFVSVGLTWLFENLRARLFAMAVALLLLWTAAGGFLAYPSVREHHAPLLEDYLRDVLEIVPAKAVVLTQGDLDGFGFTYMQRALGLRQDIVFVHPIMLHYPWYEERIEAQLSTPLSGPSNGSVDTLKLALELQATGREVWILALPSDRILRFLPSFPVGPLIRILPAGETPPLPPVLEARNLDWYARLRVPRLVPPLPDNVAQRSVLRLYARPWKVLESAFREAGNESAAAAQAARARYFDDD